MRTLQAALYDLRYLGSKAPTSLSGFGMEKGARKIIAGYRLTPFVEREVFRYVRLAHIGLSKIENQSPRTQAVFALCDKVCQSCCGFLCCSQIVQPVATLESTEGTTFPKINPGPSVMNRGEANVPENKT